MSKRIDYIIDDIKEQYLENDNNIPWIIGFSGGKDSTGQRNNLRDFIFKHII